jgi:hypothetical protein
MEVVRLLPGEVNRLSCSPEPAILENFEKFLFDQPVAVIVSFRRKKLQEVPQPLNTFTHPHCRQLHVLTLCILIAFSAISAMMFQ